MQNNETVYGMLGGREVRVIKADRSPLRTGRHFTYVVEAQGRSDNGPRHQFFDTAEDAEREAKRLLSA